MDVSSVSAVLATSPISQSVVTLRAPAQATPAANSVSAQTDSIPVRENRASGLPSTNTNAPAVETYDAPSADSLSKAVRQLNDSFKQEGQNLYATFEKDKVTGINVVKIVDNKTNETINQIPSKEIVALAQFLEQPQDMRGKLIHDTA